MTNCFNTTSIIKVNDTVIERVTKYVYLGQEVVMGKDNQANEIDRRIRLWQWAGHIARKQGSWCKAVIEWRPWGEKRPQGRPQMRWYDDIKRTAGTKWIETAQDRKRWQKMKEAYTLGVEYG
ncbi:hypothetical protein ABMA27_011488 [Loxostege sticticalis]|uniref:Endonuclease-reverse transcriptase n=1 Tax=Loxostege sticticalis TaxID=481309 RepID=A0ABR3IGF4_LOXSC